MNERKLVGLICVGIFGVITVGKKLYNKGCKDGSQATTIKVQEAMIKNLFENGKEAE